MDAFLNRAAVILASAVTYITALSAGLTIAANEIAAAAPEGSEDVVAWIVRVVAWLAAAVAIVRRVTPVAAPQRGLLPPS